MSSRALRKAQREREEQEQLRKLQEQADEAEDDDEDAGVPIPAQKSAFAMLGEAEEEDEDEDAPEDDVDTKKDQTNGDAQDSDPSPAPVTKQKKPKKKKKKAKSKVGTQDTPTKDQSLDEIDAALEALSTSNNTSQAATTAAGVDADMDELCRLLAIDTSHLHAQNEMRRLFGRAALEQHDEHAEGNAGRRRGQRQQVGLAGALRGQQNGRNNGLAALGLRRNIFIQGKEEWPVATGGGLGMEVVEKKPDGIIEYRYVHNRAYQDVQGQFDSCVASMDPNRMVQLLQYNPYHISTLLQVSEIAKQERDHATSGDLLERALFSFGRAVHSTFAKTLAEGKARMAFQRPENREFWLASWRYMQNLTMRATWRTVYEWAKLLLSLDPEVDSYALRLVVDQYALRARQDLDFLNLSRNKKFAAQWKAMPNIELSQGLAEFRAGNKGKGKQALFKAVGRYPWVIARLMQELAVDTPPGIWGKEPRTEHEKLYSELYATRGKDLWNTPEATALLVEVASALPPDTDASPLDTTAVDEAEARHVLLSDTPALISLIPRSWTHKLTSSSDPLTPADNLPSYTVATPNRSTVRNIHASPAQNLQELQGLYGFFTNLFPWFNPTGSDADERPQPSEDEIDRRIQESGLGEEVIVERTQRMMELQRQLMGSVDAEALEEHFPDAHVAGDRAEEPQDT